MPDPSSSSSSTLLPPPEALTLSASLFHANIDAWLPPSFGLATPAAARAADWDSALRQTQRDRLGLGHPDLTDEGARARAATKRAGIDTLRKLKDRRKDEDGTAPTLHPAARAEESDEEESRTKAVAKKKSRARDAFGSKKGVAAVHPLLNLRNPIAGYDAGADAANKTAPEAAGATPKAPATTATSTETVVAGTKRARGDEDDDDGDEEEDGGDAAGGASSSKSAARREKRKRAKARKAAAATAAA